MIRIFLIFAVFIVGCCKKGEIADYPEKTSQVRIIFENGHVDTVTIIHRGGLKLQNNTLTDNCPCTNDYYAQDVSAFSVIETAVIQNSSQNQNESSSEYNQ